MAISKLVVLAVLSQASWTFAADESCMVTPENKRAETPAAGHALLQVSDGSLAKPKAHSHPAHKENVHKKNKGNKSGKKAKNPDATNVPLSQSGYKTIADLCCPYEMEEFIRRTALNEKMKICDEGGLQGIVAWHTCENKQNFTTLLSEIKEASTGLCPWAAKLDSACKKTTKACGTTTDPMSHRRRNCGRADNSEGLDLVMQNAATFEFEDSVCGTHQQYSDVESKAGVMQSCHIKGDIRGNETALHACLKSCCQTADCLGIVASKDGTTLQSSFKSAEVVEGSISYLHRQR